MNFRFSTRCVLVVGFLLLSEACGQSSLILCRASARYCVQQTDDEKAMLALNDGNFGLARQILEALIADEPLTYFRYPRLAAAYSSEAGFSLTHISQLDTKASSGLFNQVSRLLPMPDPTNLSAFKAKIAEMNQARSLLLSMPKIERTQGTSFYGGSAQLQLVLYQLAYSIMFLNQFVIMNSAGGLDLKVLLSMTAADAKAFLTNLAQTVEFAGEESPAFGKTVSQVLGQIEGKSGADSRAKLIQFVQSQNSKN